MEAHKLSRKQCRQQSVSISGDQIRDNCRRETKDGPATRRRMLNGLTESALFKGCDSEFQQGIAGCVICNGLAALAALGVCLQGASLARVRTRSLASGLDSSPVPSTVWNRPRIGAGVSA